MAPLVVGLGARWSRADISAGYEIHCWIDYRFLQHFNNIKGDVK